MFPCRKPAPVQAQYHRRIGLNPDFPDSLHRRTDFETVWANCVMPVELPRSAEAGPLNFG
jgi:hypothetical protein